MGTFLGVVEYNVSRLRTCPLFSRGRGRSILLGFIYVRTLSMGVLIYSWAGCVKLFMGGTGGGRGAAIPLAKPPG